MSLGTTKPTIRVVRPAKTQISLRIREVSSVWSESLLGAFWIEKDAKFLHADNEDSDQTARMFESSLGAEGMLFFFQRKQS